jgi:NADPH-dependent 7-cyano-7-deazaguanine reductase QueF
MKPLLQLFALDLLRIPEFTDRQNLIKESNNKKILSYEMEIEKLKEKWNEPEKLKKKLEELKCKEVKACLFDKYINSLK